MKKAIDVQSQPRLGLLRTVSLTVNGIRYRLFRSSVTVVVIAVAIAFLMNVLSEGLIRNAIWRAANERTKESRRAALWAARLSVPGTLEGIILDVAASGPDGPACREAVGMGALASSEAPSYCENAREAAAYLTFFDRLEYATKRILVHAATGTEILDRLEDLKEFAIFRTELDGLRSLRFVSSAEEFRAFLDGWPRLKARTEAIRAKRTEAVKKIADGLEGRTVLDGLADMDGAFGTAVRNAGFVLDEETAGAVARQSRRLLDVRRVEETLVRPEMRKAVAAYLDILPADVSVLTLWNLLLDRDMVSWYLEKLGDGRAELGLAVERVGDLARFKADEGALARADRLVADSGSGVAGIGERMTWLIAMAMLVSVVGVANAMLMSVTERFREIATLKCLGALDGSIMLIFIVEASILGAVGGVAGAIMGAMVGMGRTLAVFGAFGGAALPIGQLLVSVAIATVLGVILAAIAAVYPAFRAARLAPMEAMRIQ